MAAFFTHMLLVLVPAVIAVLLLFTGMQTLRKYESLAGHAIGMTEVVLGFGLAGFAILMFLNIPAP